MSLQEVKTIDGWERLLTRYPDKRSALLPILHLVQREEGHVSEAAMTRVAAFLSLSPVQVYEVVSFYKLFNRERVGKFLIQVCHSLPCALRGAEGLLHALEERLRIRKGETTPDGLFTLRACECLASCGTAPAAQINDDYHENLTVQKLQEILERLKRGVHA